MPIIETIKIGLEPNDGKGEDHRSAFQKVNLNFSALNTAIQGVLDTKGQANGFASLDGNGRLLAAQAPIVYAAVLPTTTHTLNDYVTPGVWFQASIAGATAGGESYPTAQVGFLEVVATGTPVLQVFTTRNATPAIMQRFWRVRVTSTTWSNWKEVVDKTTTLSYAGRLPASQNLNTYTTRGIWLAATNVTASGGANYPVPLAGYLRVLSESELGGTAQTTAVSQQYDAVDGKVYSRFLASGVWTNWLPLLDWSQIGVAGGVAGLDTNARLPNVNFPLSVSNPAGTDANSLTSPGVYYNNSDAQATAALNWPEQLAGTLLVEAAVSGNSQVTQTYTTRNGSGGVLRTYKRVRFGGGAGIWGLWQQQARFDDAMTHVFLAAATDANTLTADNVFYTWRSGSVVVNGSNWAPVGTNISGGHLEVRWVASDMVIQTATFTASGAKPRIYQRYGSGTTWQAWKIISAVSSVVWLPTADAGDVYVDGIGWHRWNGSAYESTSLAVLLPTTAHDLDTYLTPGDWYQGVGTSATVANNYPLGALTGFLTVKTFGAATLQEYTNRAATDRKFWRTKTGASSWSVWSEAATTAVAMTRAALAAVTDANTLIADNTYYTWTGSAIPGANFPGYQAAGYMQVFWQAATIISQELTLLVTGGKPLKFARFGNSSTGVWQPWKVTGSFSSVAWMPSSNMGDIYVDGQGTYRWDAARSAYVWAPPTPTHRQGLKTEWASATTLTVYPGMCASAGGEACLLLSAANTRTVQTSGVFAHGATGNGLLTGARAANTWYYIFLLRRDSDGAVCVAFDTTFNCANRPATHSHYRRIGQCITNASNELWQYVQLGNEFWFDTPFVVYSAAFMVKDFIYTPKTYTPPNVAHSIKFTGYVTGGSGGGNMLMRRLANGRNTAWAYVVVASNIGNEINSWEIPIQATATPTVQVMAGTDTTTANLFIQGYLDYFED